MTETGGALGDALDLIERLQRAHIAYRLDSVRDALMIEVYVPGERWEIEIFPDARVEIERFISTGEIEDRDALDKLWRHAGDAADPSAAAGRGPG